MLGGFQELGGHFGVGILVGKKVDDAALVVLVFFNEGFARHDNTCWIGDSRWCL